MYALGSGLAEDTGCRGPCLAECGRTLKLGFFAKTRAEWWVAPPVNRAEMVAEKVHVAWLDAGSCPCAHSVLFCSHCGVRSSSAWKG